MENFRGFVLPYAYVIMGVWFVMKRNITKEVLNDKEFLDIVSPILNNKEFDARKNWKHHEHCSLYEHCLIVSYLSYEICKKRGFNYHDAAIGGLLHDFYYSPWQDHLDEKVPFFKQHGFVHAREALRHSYEVFPELMNARIANIILRHMFPLNVIPPKYKEGWVITYVDKKVSLDVVLDVKAIYKYLGLARIVHKFKRFFRR